MEKEKNYVSPKLDIVFRMLFGEKQSEKITKNLVESVLGEKVDSIDLSETPELKGDYVDDKNSVVDIMATVNGDTKLDIEMQMNNRDYLIKRLLSYWSKIYNKNLKKGDEYNELPRCICIMFINEDIPSLKHLHALTSWKIMEESEKKTILTNDFQICIIEIRKAKRLGTNKELLKWIEFLENPEGEMVKKMAKEYDEIDEAIQRLEEITADKEMQAKIEARQKYYLDLNSEKSSARRIGREEGLAEGRAEGRAEERKEIAKQMLAKNIDEQVIMELIGLTKEELEQLKKI